MASDLDKVVVVDLEATCWEGQPPAGEQPEIIEIGVCLLDTSRGTREDKRSIMVKPRRSRVSPFCTKLTTLTQADVDKGIPLADAVAELEKLGKNRGRTWASWGDYDRLQLGRECEEQKIELPFGRTHLNVKNLFALRRGSSREPGLDKAMEEMSLPMEGTHHRGADDAWNIAKLLWELVRWR
jgi:inhibitor of KinA sporulation pathway (predicted exonuclease)